MNRIRKILIANRGEIAVRIMKTARKMGIQTVAVYAANDKHASHVSFADEAYPLGEGTLNDTYLNLSRIEAIIRQAEVDAVHPGYGFLSENPELPELCQKSNVAFIGPSAEAIREMGDKIRSRELADKAGVKISKGITGRPEDILLHKHHLEYPVLVKASAGGGGKGMRIVEEDDKLEDSLKITAREAHNNFGSKQVYVEHYFKNPRHIEVQILGDRHGNMMHLFERECSLQRRHQKVIEEAPSVSVDDELRKKLTQNAIKLAKEINYSSAGTVEFLVDRQNRIYFLEMNTRIQVEHPVTEKITGIDIVEQQIRIARGEELSLRQEELQIQGNAIQARLYAEDPLQNYKPSPGFFQTISFPENVDIRIDHGLKKTDFIDPDYDPMIAKVIAHSYDRKSAVDKLSTYLRDVTIIGQPTNQEFLREILENSDFLANRISTQYLEENTNQLIDQLNIKKGSISPASMVAAFVVTEINYCLRDDKEADAWERIGFWRIRDRVKIEFKGKEYEVFIRRVDDRFDIQIEDSLITASCKTKNQDNCVVEINNVERRFKIVKQNESEAVLKYKGYYYPVKRLDILKKTNHEAEYHQKSGMQKSVISPLHGRVVLVNVNEHQQVQKGNVLLVIESMKIENNILAEANVQIDKIEVKEGEQVRDGQVLMTMKANELVNKEE